MKTIGQFHSCVFQIFPFGLLPLEWYLPPDVWAYGSRDAPGKVESRVRVREVLESLYRMQTLINQGSVHLGRTHNAIALESSGCDFFLLICLAGFR